MKNIFLTFAIVILGSSLMAQTTNMMIRTTDGNTHSYPITEVDSVYYQVGSSFTCGDDISDIDGNTYGTVQIGNQCWISENLKVTHYPNGDAIPLVTDNTAWDNLADDDTSDAYSYYDNSSANATTYGALYTYAASIGDNWARDNTANQGVCPDGWHLPTDAEWTTLETYLGANAASKLAGNAALWTDGDLDQSADFGTSGFFALPSGYRDNSDGAFYDVGEHGYWWSSTEYDSSTAYYRYLHYYSANVNRYYYYKSNGFSVRCVRD